MARRATGEPAFDARLDVPCFASDLERWKRWAESKGLKLTEYARRRMPQGEPKAPGSTGRQNRRGAPK